ncbi:MAG: YdcF family protein [Planctomycetaceae bacterium]|nr:YdcF family protein [Planctomycetaceae bacterium]
MVYASLPSRKATTRGRVAAHRMMAFMDGARLFLGAILIVDAARSFFSPDASLLNTLVRLPGGQALPSIDGLLLGIAFLVRHRVAALVLLAHLVLAGVNVAEFYLLRAQGLAAAPVPFSLITVALLVGGIARTFYDGPTGSWKWVATGAAAAGPALLLIHLFSFGATDYARPAKAIVVFGARVYTNGDPSLALEDRVRHGIALYHAGLAPRLILSGAPDEVPAMRRLALAGKVPEAALVCDAAGVNSYATLANLRERDVVAVSHYYHLARIKLTAHRLGIACATSPCPMTRRLAKEPFFVARECAAFVSYYLFRG